MLSTDAFAEARQDRDIAHGGMRGLIGGRDVPFSGSASIRIRAISAVPGNVRQGKETRGNGSLRVLGVGRATKPRGRLLTGSGIISLIFTILICLVPTGRKQKKPPLFRDPCGTVLTQNCLALSVSPVRCVFRFILSRCCSAPSCGRSRSMRRENPIMPRKARD